MSSSFIEKVVCPTCDSTQETVLFNSINVTKEPAFKEPFFNKEVNWMRCKSCDTNVFIPIEFVYHDMDKKFLVIFKHPNQTDTKTEDEFAEFAGRLKIAEYMLYPVIVRDPYQLILAAEICDEKRGPTSKEESSVLASVIMSMLKIQNSQS